MKRLLRWIVERTLAASGIEAEWNAARAGDADTIAGLRRDLDATAKFAGAMAKQVNLQSRVITGILTKHQAYEKADKRLADVARQLEQKAKRILRKREAERALSGALPAPVDAAPVELPVPPEVAVATMVSGEIEAVEEKA